MTLRPSAFAAVVAFFASTAFGACAVNSNGLSSREVRTFTVIGTPELVVETFDGAIEIHSWDRNGVEVEIDKRAMEQAPIDQMKVDVEQQGDRIVVRVTAPPRGDHRGIRMGRHISPTASLRVVVPRAVNLEARSGAGSIRIEALDGRLVLNSGDGNVTGVRVSGDIRIRTGDGSITLEDTAGKLDLETDEGNIGIDGRPTALHAETAEGTIRVKVDPDSAMAADWDLTSGDGNVILTLPATFHAEVDAETGSGAVRGDLHPLLKEPAGPPGLREGEDGDERRERQRTLRATMGDGGKILKVRTGNGWIRFEH